LLLIYQNSHLPLHKASLGQKKNRSTEQVSILAFRYFTSSFRVASGVVPAESSNAGVCGTIFLGLMLPVKGIAMDVRNLDYSYN
jgi:hypothetical protein